MNNIKLLATLFVGIFIGYILATISVIDQQDARNIMLDEQTVTASQLMLSLQKKIQTVWRLNTLPTRRIKR